MKINMKEYMKKRRLERRQKLIDMAGGKCSLCGSENNLEFDHTDRKEKKFTLSGCYLDKSWTKILEEFKKCTILCSSCHIEKSRFHKDYCEEPWNKNNDPFIHGTARTYSEKKCRCSLCKRAKSLYRRKVINYLDLIPESEIIKIMKSKTFKAPDHDPKLADTVPHINGTH